VHPLVGRGQHPEDKTGADFANLGRVALRMTMSIPELVPLMGEFRSGHLYALCASQNASAVPLAVMCTAATNECLEREIAWEDVQVSSPWHYRGARTPSEELQLRERIQANRGKPLYLLNVGAVPPGALEASLRSLPRLPQVVFVDEGPRRQDTEPAEPRRLAAALQVPVLLLCSLARAHEDGPELADIPEAITRSADVLLAIGDPHFGEEQEEEAVPDYFYTPVTRLGEISASTVLLRSDLTTNRFTREA
jgi:hypothetical protein